MRTFATTLLFLIPLAAADKHPWASFKPGSYAKMKTTTTTGPTKMVSEITQTLISVDANNAVVEMETKAMGQTTKTRVPMPLKAAATPAANAQAPKMSAPVNENVTVAGKSIAAKCVEMETSANGMTTSTRSCSSETVPGGVVKAVSKSTGAVKMESVTELVEFAAK